MRAARIFVVKFNIRCVAVLSSFEGWACISTTLLLIDQLESKHQHVREISAVSFETALFAIFRAIMHFDRSKMDTLVVFGKISIIQFFSSSCRADNFFICLHFHLSLSQARSHSVTRTETKKKNKTQTHIHRERRDFLRKNKQRQTFVNKYIQS